MLVHSGDCFLAPYCISVILAGAICTNRVPVWGIYLWGVVANGLF
jgi:hypothetical protein